MGIININSKIGTVNSNVAWHTDIPYCEILDIQSITPYNAWISGKTISTSTVSEKGFCYGTGSTPTINDSKTIITGNSINITGLTSGSTYYVRAYAINSFGVGYSSAKSFITTNVTQFKTTGTWTYYTPAGATKLEYLVIAGGGAGGNNAGGGGGAGGYRCSVNGESSGGGAAAEAPLTGASITSTFTVVVGAGGIMRQSSLSTNINTNSSFGSIVSIGGGRGSEYANPVGISGGSGGGIQRYSTAGTTNGGAGVAGQGYAGGNATNSNSTFCSTGGGGAGGAGENATNTRTTKGGVGLQSSITGSAVWRGGGGGCDLCTANNNGGGGYNGKIVAVPNTGGGGGGSGFNQPRNSFSDGASGIVIIKAYFN